MIFNYHKLLYFLPVALVTGPFLPDLIVVICSIFFLIDTFRLKLFSYFNNNFFKIFLIFFLLLNLSSFFSDNVISFKYSLSYLRYGIFTIFIFYVFKNFENSIKIFSYIVFSVFILLIVDGYIQLFFGNNILNFKLQNFHTGLSYVTSFFNEEKKLGSYLARLSPIFFIAILFIQKNYNFKLNIYIFALTFLLFSIILLSTERVSIFIICGFLFFLFLKTNYLIKHKKIFGLLLILITIIFLFLNQALFEKLKSVLYSSGLMFPGLTDEGKVIGAYEQGLFIYSKFYHDQIFNAYEIYKNNIFFGIGPKNFKLYVSDAWHPHNYHAQVLSEIGIFGYFIIISLFIFFLVKILKFNFIKKINNIYDEMNYMIMTIIFLNVLPIPSGDFFNNWLNIILYIPFGYYLFLNEKKI